MLIDVAGVRATDDNHIGLGLGHIVERERLVFPYIEPWAKRSLQHLANTNDDDRMPATFRFANDQQAVKELDRVVFLESALGDHRVVSGARHPPEPGRLRLFRSPARHLSSLRYGSRSATRIFARGATKGVMVVPRLRSLTLPYFQPNCRDSAFTGCR